MPVKKAPFSFFFLFLDGGDLKVCQPFKDPMGLEIESSYRNACEIFWIVDAVFSSLASERG